MMEQKTPTANGRGLEKLGGQFQVPFSLAALRAQHLAARYALPLETAAIMAALAFGGAHHG